MSESYWDNVNVTCPFFKYESNKEIVCEGVVDGSDNRIRFTGIKNKKSFEEIHCCSDYKNCPIAQALYKKYDSVC